MHGLASSGFASCNVVIPLVLLIGYKFPTPPLGLKQGRQACPAYWLFRGVVNSGHHVAGVTTIFGHLAPFSVLVHP
jgi:hypothetical protein